MKSPDRFAVSQSTLMIDRFMGRFIVLGGLLVILAVFAIFLFILFQVMPLFRSAQVEPIGQYAFPSGDVVVIGMDEWGERPFELTAGGRIWFADARGGEAPTPIDLHLPRRITAARYDARGQRLIVGMEDGSAAIISIVFETAFVGDKRSVTGNALVGEPMAVGREGLPVVAVAYGDSGTDKLLAVIQQGADGQRFVRAVALTQSRGLLGGGTIEAGAPVDLTESMHGRADRILVNDRGDSVVIADDAGKIWYFFRAADAFELRQTFAPFDGCASPLIASMDYLVGDVSLVLTNPDGANRVFSLHLLGGGNTRLFGLTKELDPLPGGAICFSPSPLNKAFFLGSDRIASLRFMTSASVRWQSALDFTIQRSALNSKYDRLALMDASNVLHLYSIRDPHPESGFKALFGKIWYEGASAPRHVWQSSGGFDDFEPKLSMVNLIFGTLKGTFYALLFSVPVALLAAVYSAEFMHRRFKSVVKPVMEIMASLPSVVLGFLAAQWLAPAIEDRVPSLLCVIVILPLAAMGFGAFWSRLPMTYRRCIKPGYEFLVFIPLMLAVGLLGWSFGPVLEHWFFAGDFRQWWPRHTGASFEQRNSLVVGFMMGFAVIPIIFTITEDALTNVPKALRSGSLALGASRWQTAFRIVLPTASAGIFSALMIGVGRAIGETMIVVMATGNTPIMDWNIFNGMRTLSATIAVELPEAAEGGTLYRTLFFGAFLLFLMTFAINTVAEILRQHLRDRYKTV